MIEALLLFGVLACLAACAKLAHRVSTLEARIAYLAADRSHPAVDDSFEPVARIAVALPRAAAEARGGVPEPVAVEPAAFEPVAIVPMPEVAGPTPSRAADVAGLFERFVGGRLLVWTGGIAIALAGLFLVRYSIERGLLSPAARMVGAATSGFALLGAGEWARRRVVDDPRIGQALVGAGVLILYAAAYGSHVLYALIGLPTAFALMAGVAGAALALSLRHGAPAAALGLVAGFATPLLVGDVNAGALPLLGYLALLGVAVFAAAARTERPWLAWAARWLTLGWTAWLMADVPEQAAVVGAFVASFTLASVHALRGNDERRPTLAPGFALLQLGAMVIAGFGADEWAILLAFGGAAVAGARGHPALATTPGRALLTAVLLIFGATAGLGDQRNEAPAALAATMVFAVGAWSEPAARVRRAWIFCLAVAGPAAALRIGEPALLARWEWAASFAGLSLAPIAFAWRARGAARRQAPFDRALLLATATAAGLLMLAAADALPLRWVPVGWLVVAAAVLAGARGLADGGLLRLAATVAGGAALFAAGRAWALWETIAASLGGRPALVGALPDVGDAMLLLGAPALLLGALWRATPASETRLARGFALAAGLFALAAAYVAYKQGFALRTPADFAARGFAERALLTQALFAGGWALLARPGAAWMRVAGWALTGIAAARFGWFDLVVHNPAAYPQAVGALPVANLLLPAYGGAAFWLWRARRRASGPPATLLFSLFVAALVAGTALGVRQSFAGSILVGPAVSRAEFYGYSLGGLLLSVSLLVWGWRRGDTRLRVAGLALLSVAVLKVFLVDAAALEGILRIVSFAGLGVALIGMGKLYGTLLGRRPTPKPDGLSAEASA